MTDQEIKDLIRCHGRVQASLTQIQTFVQQCDEGQDVLNIKLRMGRLGEIWNKYEGIQDRLEGIDRVILLNMIISGMILKRSFMI
jgi:hypothetical protein